VAGRQAGWATAWRPAAWERGARVGHTHSMVTVRWQGAVAGPRAPANNVSPKRRREHHGGGGNAPDEVVAVMAHLSSDSMCGAAR
jgi:hypothetical protein